MFYSGCQDILKTAIARQRTNYPERIKVSRHSTEGALEGRLYKTSLPRSAAILNAGCDTITANKERRLSCIGFIAGLLSLRATPLVERNEQIGHRN
jgi:hypothetical protein